jgi:tryptophan synthase alpha chain
MSARIEETFARASAGGSPVLIAYLCIGDPTVEGSCRIARALLDAGADALELGAPFSDPTADGPTIARAAARAIAAGGSMRKAIEVGARLRNDTDAPLILFGYENPILVNGERETVRAVADAGIDAMLIVDLPPEEGEELRDEARARGVDVIPLVTPTSSAARVEAARGVASGFVYYVSVTGVTGATLAKAADPFDAAAKAAAELRASLGLPVVVGFGIDDGEKARRACGSGNRGLGADGVVVGTAIVAAIEEAAGDLDDACRRAAAVVSAIRSGLATSRGF